MEDDLRPEYDLSQLRPALEQREKRLDKIAQRGRERTPVLTDEQAKSVLVLKVEGLQGAKGPALASHTDIALSLMEFDVPRLLDELVAEGRLVEVEYIIPEMDHRVKSFYLPAKTRVRVLNSE